MHLVHRQSCRVCGSQALTTVIDLGWQNLQGSFVKPGKEPPPKRLIPLRLMRCDPTRDEKACGLLQLAHSTPPEILYDAYWYRSGTNRTMRDHLAGIAAEAVALCGHERARVLDIGCNDGTLLQQYPAQYVKFGVDPSDVALAAGGGDVTVIHDLFPSHKLEGKGPFDVVTSIACFYDLERPGAFANAVRDLLSDSGVWIFEVSYMPGMLARNSYDTICNEHLEYYSLAVLERITALAGMRVFRAELNDCNGGSIRVYATPTANAKLQSAAWDDGIRSLHHAEFDLALDTDAPYHAFQTRAEKCREDLRALVMRLRSEGKRIHVYGASTKGNTILQWCELGREEIECCADRNPDKHGARTLGTDIPIVSEEESRAMRPDYYLVLPWHFRAEFLEREKAALDSGVGMIFPLPTIEIVKR